MRPQSRNQRQQAIEAAGALPAVAAVRRAPLLYPALTRLQEALPHDGFVRISSLAQLFANLPLAGGAPSALAAHWRRVRHPLGRLRHTRIFGLCRTCRAAP